MNMLPNAIENRNIVIVGQQPWDTEIGSNCKDIALEFSKKNKVLYVNSPLDRISSIRDRKNPAVRERLDIIAGRKSGLVQIKSNLWNLYPDCLVESVNWLNNRWLFNKINRFNNRRFANSIQRASAILGFDRYILFNDNEIIKCFYLAELLHPDLSVYYSRDYILATPYWKKHGHWLEPQVIAANDLCVANSMYLADYCRQYNANTFYVGQGCDQSNFLVEGEVRTAQDLKDIETPIVGYVGALQSLRLDIGLLEYIAINRPDWTVVLVGPEDEQFKSSKLHNLPNVVFLGFRPPEMLATYIRSFDVCINPQLVNELTIGNYPRKIDEYLAAGKPVVATATRAMEVFSEYVYLAKDESEYLTFIELAMAEDHPAIAENRKTFAQQHTWENSVNEIYGAMIAVWNTKDQRAYNAIDE